MEEVKKIQRNKLPLKNKQVMEVKGTAWGIQPIILSYLGVVTYELHLRW